MYINKLIDTSPMKFNLTVSKHVKTLTQIETKKKGSKHTKTLSLYTSISVSNFFNHSQILIQSSLRTVFYYNPKNSNKFPNTENQPLPYRVIYFVSRNK